MARGNRTIWTRGAALALLTLLAAAPAHADNPDRAIYVGIYGGRHLSLDEWVIGDLEGTDNHLLDSATLGLRVGGHLFQWLAFEANLGWLPSEVVQGGDVNVLDFGVHAMFLAPYKDFAAYFLGGGGGYASLDGAAGSDVNGHGDLGLGLRFMVHDYVAIRLQGRAMFTKGRDQDVTANFEVTAGLDIMAWRSANDRDGDGIADETDDCPDTFGVKTGKGCPDKDGDGIKDADDACVEQAGPVATKGCPDRDGDGIRDADDRCPDDTGTAEFKGCPDSDGDKIADIDDDCPQVPCIAALRGCPDADADGITDAKDACPKEAGPKELGGCPDRDRDGIADKDDKCPDVPGLEELEGCLPKEVEEKFSGALEGIHFETNSAKIQRRSNKVLDDAVAILVKYPTVRVRIEGHTDDQGTKDYNKQLSQDRADAVKQYLVDEGVDAARIETIGHGMDKPAVPNTSRKNRAQNRRIEFHVISR